ncbi:hypothetical protein C5749_04370 [Sphingobacterium gobiense]|uniref:O-antigen ligase domain-containing protein n=2 Tax=Sphingobacterium gobiense TaxID=1382456 RepID=A0A2S9JTB4_9SPHI|nr:hypothetical protein C5749_04370 [Sphingobacterium gobiense]
MIRIILYILLGILTSFYLFPVGLTILPDAFNTKMVLALVGGLLFGYNSLQERGISVQMGLLGAVGIALFFSIVCYIATDLNNTADYAYVTYLGSMFTWLGGAYMVCMAIKGLHGRCNFRVLTNYLAAVCFVQCGLALLIDNHEGFQLLVDSYVQQGQAFYEDKDRLYGIGAALDTAGVRFSIVLLMISALLCHDEQVRKSTSAIVALLLVFFTVALVGNMISRTTIIGLAGGMLYAILFSGLFRFEIRFSALKLGIWATITLVLVVAIGTFLYRTNDDFYGHIRFAFEGFFNLVETGEWRTGSTDKLNNEMWIWPEDTKTWIIGSGIFGSFVYATDIGYCRFILYCGLVGFSIFSLFFVYNGLFFMNRSGKYATMFVVLIVMSFIFWVKIATDIFLIYALFYCVDEFVSSGNNDDGLLMIND